MDTVKCVLEGNGAGCSVEVNVWWQEGKAGEKDKWRTGEPGWTSFKDGQVWVCPAAECRSTWKLMSRGLFNKAFNNPANDS